MTETRVRYPVRADASLDPPTAKTTLLHQMRPWPPMWRRPVEDRPPYAVWVIASLVPGHSSWLPSWHGT